jgi:putative SOS response-associated peptidase YedK
MCGRFSVVISIDKLIERFEADATDNWNSIFPRYNAAPGQDLPVLTNEDPKQVNLYRWGLIPFWAKDKNVGYKMINARSETLLEKGTFKNALKSKRCLVLADSFYEWKKGEKNKVPHRIHLEDFEPFAMAGLWDTWRDENKNVIRSFTIITTQANKLISGIHDRMPVILKRENEKEWLDTSIPIKKAVDMLQPYPENKMRTYTISTLVNSPKNDVKEIIDECDWQ